MGKLAPADPRTYLPSRAHPQHRSARKELERRQPGFDWTPPLVLGLIGVGLAWDIEKQVRRAEERHAREEEQERERERERDGGGRNNSRRRRRRHSTSAGRQQQQQQQRREGAASLSALRAAEEGSADPAAESAPWRRRSRRRHASAAGDRGDGCACDAARRCPRHAGASPHASGADGRGREYGGSGRGEGWEYGGSGHGEGWEYGGPGHGEGRARSRGRERRGSP
ncbi:hypothetical protein GGS23DRAFT_593670 [Durotheca rogersii]|uniref:uncharacterized protein n=1 Tax=Durotheca rogersii TaxID=419775 RepID=UPI00221FA41A|nr:uncharacterized protein GGS23DRAFT_593670 [Durotheca rogersii]KAI5866938.1 hypothetical protein GGS23DRAFT_593670 [Durotheca rogersii]